MKNILFALKSGLLLWFLLCTASVTIAQEESDFTNKITEVYTAIASGDQEQAQKIAYELFESIESTPSLQTYTNYYTLYGLFLQAVKDDEKAKICEEKGKALVMGQSSATSTNGNNYGSNAQQEWFDQYYNDLFTTTNPDHPKKAWAFLKKHTELQTFSNLSYLAYAFEKTGDFQQAEKFYNLSLTKVENPTDVYHSFSYHILFFTKIGQYTKAEELINKLKKLSKTASKLLQQSYYTEILTSESSYLLYLGDYHNYIASANKMYDHFEGLMKGQPCNALLGARYTITAHANEQLGHYTEAAKLWQKRDIASKKWVSCYNQQGYGFQYTHYDIYPIFQLKRGETPTTDLQQLQRDIKQHWASIKDYENINHIHSQAIELGFLKSPEYPKLFEKVINQITTQKDFSESTLPLANYGYFLTRDHQYQKSFKVYEHLFTANEEWINDLMFSFGERAFINYFHQKIKPGYEQYHSFVKIANERQHNLLPQLCIQDYENLLLTKSLGFKGIKKRKQLFLQSGSDEVKELYTQWLYKKKALLSTFQKQQASKTDTATVYNKEQISELQKEVTNIEDALTRAAGELSTLLKITTPKWEKVKNSLKPTEAAIEIFKFQWKDQVYLSDTIWYGAYIVKAASKYPEVVFFPTLGKQLETRYYNFYQKSIENEIEDPYSYDQYWTPLKEKLEGIDKIYFAPDGIFHLINLPSIQNPDNGQYILEEKDIQYVTSTANLIDEKSFTPNQNATLLGRPIYKTQNYVASNTQQENNTRSLTASFRSNANVADLPGTEEEVLAIESEMNAEKLKVDLFLGEKAQEEIFYQFKTSPNILHIATHGFWSELDHPATKGYQAFNALANSGLLLSGVINYYSAQEFPNGHDGILTAYEVQSLNLENTNLVVLSACETGLGKIQAGEGVYGLQRAFRVAGARFVISSLWKVNDAATKDFMIHFYQEYLKSGDPQLAFRATQVSMKAKYKLPYYWGAFTLTGN